jgi:hypothetical protein
VTIEAAAGESRPSNIPAADDVAAYTPSTASVTSDQVTVNVHARSMS